MTACIGCQTPFPEFDAATHLFCATDIAHVMQKVKGWAKDYPVPLTEVADYLILELSSTNPRIIMAEIGGLLSPMEQAALRLSLLNTAATDLQTLVQAAFRARALDEWLGILSQEWLGDVLRDERLTSFFQPVFHTNGQGLFGYEALMRGVSSDGELISAYALLNAARTSNALFALDQRARSTSIRTAKEVGLTDEKLLINFLPTVIYDPAVCLGTTLKAMRETGLKASQIVFEVVETEHVADADFLRNVLKYYRDLGFEVALDDLGAGHSSLLLLADLHPNFAKLVMRLVSAAVQSRLTGRLVESICNVARSEGIRIIAEGIETEEVYRYCQDKGIDLVQGYYLGRPSPSLLPAQGRTEMTEHDRETEFEHAGVG